ncbi:AzlC family ABC transporter permease [Acidimicrobiia bacterium EGI L10123]|uniref:AzlC family ABC transporter permease n=1 Tax=Salinilacustrithrix flava TaxID=2957203 RepID=UPI003D7C2F4D|nr:AzlC family ABC transporter permease [Acidimicrobiia bacterium EGI L10123]
MTVTAPTATDRDTTTASFRGGPDLLAGARAMLPWLVGVVPFGLMVGITVGSSSIDHGAGLATGVTIYAGSAQLAAISLLEQGAAPAVAVATVLAINARLVFYSASMAPRWQGTSAWFRASASYLLIDPSYAVGAAGYDRHPGCRGNRHYIGAALVLWAAWQLSIIAGYLAGAGVPEALHLEHAIPLFLLAELGHSVRGRPALTAAAVGALVAVVGSGLPLHAGPLLGIAAGIGAAGLVEGSRP